LLSSNIEWGQDLESVRRWANANAECRPLYVMGLPSLEAEALGIPSSGFPPSGPEIDTDVYVKPDPSLLGPAPGWFAVGITAMMADGHPERGGPHDLGYPYCGYFRSLTPCGTFGYSMYLYHLTLDEANSARTRWGLPPLPPGFEPPERYPLLLKTKRHATATRSRDTR
jgi:hypothetical protein